MKKTAAYFGFGLLSLAGLFLIGTMVVAFLQTRLEISNERLDAREEERSAIEDHWIEYHETNKDSIIED